MNLHHRGAAALARVAAAALALAGIVAVAVGAPASAAVIDGAVTNITVSPTNPRVNELIRTTVDWCVPDGTRAGDTFTISLPEQLGGFPPGFPVTDAAGEVVANVVIAGSDPILATFTMTDYAQTRTGVCGDAWFESRIVDSNLADTTQTLTYVVNGSLTFERQITILPARGTTRATAVKYGAFTNTDDQCRNSTVDCIMWGVESRIGPFDEVTFQDVATTGTTFNCARLEVHYFTLNPDLTKAVAFTPAQVGATVAASCSTASFSVTTGPVPPDMIVRVRVPATPDMAIVEGGVVFVNNATVTHTANGVDIVDQVNDSRRSAAVGGSASGDSIDIEKSDEAGNDADTSDAAVLLPDGSTGLRFTVVNTGSSTLLDVTVTDVVVVGGTISGLSCDFSMAAAGAPTSGTAWAGPFAPGARFDCTAELTGVEPGVVHQDSATVTGTGAVSGNTVTDTDDYHALVPDSGTTTTQPGSTTTTQPGVTTTSVAQLLPTTTAAGAVTTSTAVTTGTLPRTGVSTGSMSWLALVLLAAGAALAAAARRRTVTAD